MSNPRERYEARAPNNHHSSPAAPATPAGSGITFAQYGAVVGNNGLTHDGIECYHCHSIGHYASNCPTVSNTTVTSGTTLTQYAYMLAQAQSASGIDPQWILLDSQSTISVFNNASMLKDQLVRAGFQRSAKATAPDVKSASGTSALTMTTPV